MAAGDISKGLLAQVRTFIDENSANFWEDSEIYSALSDAQKEYASIVLTIYKEKLKIDKNLELPEVLRGLVTTEVDTIAAVSSTFTIPSDFMYDLSLKYNHQSTSSLKPCFKREIDKNYYFKQANSLLQADTTKEYYYSLNGTTFAFETEVSIGTGGYSLVYLAVPTAITSSVDPVLPGFTFPALLQYAFGDVINKDGRTQESLAYYSKFQNMVQFK